MLNQIVRHIIIDTYIIKIKRFCLFYHCEMLLHTNECTHVYGLNSVSVSGQEIWYTKYARRSCLCNKLPFSYDIYIFHQLESYLHLYYSIRVCYSDSAPNKICINIPRQTFKVFKHTKIDHAVPVLSAKAVIKKEMQKIGNNLA